MGQELHSLGSSISREQTPSGHLVDDNVRVRTILVESEGGVLAHASERLTGIGNRSNDFCVVADA